MQDGRHTRCIPDAILPSIIRTEDTRTYSIHVRLSDTPFFPDSLFFFVSKRFHRSKIIIFFFFLSSLFSLHSSNHQPNVWSNEKWRNTFDIFFFCVLTRENFSLRLLTWDLQEKMDRSKCESGKFTGGLTLSYSLWKWNSIPVVPSESHASRVFTKRKKKEIHYQVDRCRVCNWFIHHQGF